MTRELVDRMRTCAATLEASQASGNPWDLALLGKDAARLLRIAADTLDTPEPLGEPPLILLRDAADLLIEASNELTLMEPAEEPIGEPMDVIKAKAAQHDPTWGGQLPTVGARPCPSCGSIDARTVKRAGRKLMLTCPVCEHEWEYR